jgi:hypothetical protein
MKIHIPFEKHDSNSSLQQMLGREQLAISASVLMSYSLGCQGPPIYSSYVNNYRNYWTTYQTMWALHDGAPAHSSRDVMRYLDSHYPRRWIGRNGSVVWPPRSPDLTPADFYLWGHLKSIVYAKRCNPRDELWNAIEAAVTTIRNMPDIFQQTRNSWRNGAQLCFDCNGRPFQHVL